MQTDAFSLAGYTATDKPTLYFSYWLETQDAQDNEAGPDEMRDSARVLGSIDGGQTWELLATNNQERSSLDTGPQAELPPRLTPSANAANAGSNASERQQVQELLTPLNGGKHVLTLDNLLARVQCFCDLILVPVVILTAVVKSITPRSLQMRPDKLFQLPLLGM